MNHVALFLLGEMRLFCKEGTWRQGLEGGLQSLTPLETMRTLWRCRACLASSTALHGRGCCGCSAGPIPSASGSADAHGPQRIPTLGMVLAEGSHLALPNSLPPGICQDPLPSRSSSFAGSSCLQSGLWIRWGLTCSCYSPVTVDPKRAPSKPSTHKPSSQSVSWESLFSCSVESNSATPWTAAHQASLSLTISWSFSKFMCIESVVPSNHLISAVLFSFAFSLSQHQGFFQWVDSSHQVTKVLEFQHQSFQWVFIIQWASWGTYPKRRLSSKLFSRTRS